MPAKLPPPEAAVTLLELNRATLSRQTLLRREQAGVVEAVERLAGLQAQYSPSPYIGLWTRLEGFRFDDLTQALLDRTIVKASLMRWTLHLVSARDYPFFTTAMIDMRVASWRSVFQDAGLDLSVEGSGLDLSALHENLLEFAAEPRLFDDLVEFVRGQVPENVRQHPRVARHAAGALGWLVHTPPSGTWKYFGKNPYISARRWLEKVEEPSTEEAMTYLIRRYLAAFGPASRADALQWSGLRVVSQVDTALQRLGDEVIAFKDERGKILYDLSRAPRPGGDALTPPRFLPKWDNLLLAYEDRQRVLPEKYRKVVIRKNGDVLPTFLLDGMVAGTWEVTTRRNSATLHLQPFEPVDSPSRSLLEEEGGKLVRFVEPEAGSYEINFQCE